MKARVKYHVYSNMPRRTRHSPEYTELGTWHCSRNTREEAEDRARQKAVVHPNHKFSVIRVEYSRILTYGTLRPEPVVVDWEEKS